MICKNLSWNICLSWWLSSGAQMAVGNRNIRRLHVQKRSAMVTFRRKLTGGRRAQRTEGSRTEQTGGLCLLCLCPLPSARSRATTGLAATRLHHRSTATSRTPQSDRVGCFCLSKLFRTHYLFDAWLLAARCSVLGMWWWPVMAVSCCSDRTTYGTRISALAGSLHTDSLLLLCSPSRKAPSDSS